jgi:hypothetical protein
MAPDRIENIVAAERLAGVARQQRKHREGLGFQRLFDPAPKQAVTGRIDDHVFEGNTGGWG